MYDETQFRARLGSWLVLFSIAALVLLGIVVILGAAWNGAAAFQSASQLLLSSLLPLFGTWIGTVLAFYYTKENFESASKGTLDLVRSVTERLHSTHVTEAMMSASDMITLVVPQGASLGDVRASEVKKKFDQKGGNAQRISRLPVLSADQVCVGVLHRGMWTEMLADSPAEFDPDAGSMNALISRANPLHEGQTYEQTIRNSVAFVSSRATVAEAKIAMEQKPSCQDVIVTATGVPSERVLGWISNIDIGRLSQA